MYRLFSSVILMGLLLGCKTQTVEIDGNNLIENDGVYIAPDTGLPFTGLAKWHYDNGQLKTYINYEDGIRNGLNEDFFEDGLLSEKSVYIEGKRNGLHEEFYDNGQMMERRHYVYGKGNGVWEWYSRVGTLVSRKYYVNGVEVSQE